MKEKYLPIGTVVLLKDATKHLMITGYCSSTPEDPNKFYDYVSLLFPEGALAGESVALFDHEQIGSVVHMGLVNDEFTNLNNVIKESIASDQAAAAAQPAPAANGELPPFTPENINLMLQEIHKHGDEYKPIAEPTAFDEEAIKKPMFQLPSLDGGSKKEEKKEEEEEEDDSDFNFEEEPIETEEKEVVPEGQPVLQLQPIFEGDSVPSSDSSPASDGGIIGLTRL